MPQATVIGLYYILLLEGVGLLLIHHTVRSVWIRLQGTLQVGTAVIGFTFRLARELSSLWWLAILLAVVGCRCLLHYLVAKRQVDISALKPDAIYFAPEMYAYFVASALVFYVGKEAMLSLPEWGAVSWNLAFGTTLVLLWTLGGIALMNAVPGKLLLFATRLFVACGVASVLQQVIFR